jgi:hypothetical protein
MTAPGELLVGHGCAALLSRCPPPESLCPSRGDRVVLRSRRGLEIGTVLAEASVSAVSAGELLRLATADDERLAETGRERGRRLVADAERLVGERSLPISPLDAEVLLDDATAVLHVLKWGDCEVTPLVEELRRASGLAVTLWDVSKPAAPTGGCGKEGCGGGNCGSCGESGGGGCSTGGCSSGQFKSADELTAYFAELRRQMHAAGRVPLV